MMLSAKFFTSCLADQEGTFAFKELTGLPFRELLLPCLIIPGVGAVDDMQAFFHQLRLLQLIIHLEEDEAILETIQQERIIFHSASIVRRAPRGPRCRYRRTTDMDRPPIKSDWFDAILLMWEAVFHWAGPALMLPTGVSLVAEALESKIIFLLEDWSIFALDEHLRKCSACHGSVSCGLSHYVHT